MNDINFTVEIIRQICDYAVNNGMIPDETLRTMATNIIDLLSITTFNGWVRGDENE